MGCEGQGRWVWACLVLRYAEGGPELDPSRLGLRGVPWGRPAPGGVVPAARREGQGEALHPQLAHLRGERCAARAPRGRVQEEESMREVPSAGTLAADASEECRGTPKAHPGCDTRLDYTGDAARAIFSMRRKGKPPFIVIKQSSVFLRPKS